MNIIELDHYVKNNQLDTFKIETYIECCCCCSRHTIIFIKFKNFPIMNHFEAYGFTTNSSKEKAAGKALKFIKKHSEFNIPKAEIVEVLKN